MAVLTFEETCEALRDKVREGVLFGWNHRDCQHALCDIYTLSWPEGHEFPRTREWTQARVERWLREQRSVAGTLENLGL